MATRPRIVVTGLGAVTPLGADARALAEALRSGARGTGPISHFADTPFEGRVGGGVAPGLVPPGARASRGATSRALAVRSAREALAQSGGSADPGRTAIVIGTTMTPKERPLEDLAAQIRGDLELPESVVIAVSTACTSSSAVFAIASDLLRSGAFDRILAGGADELDVKSFAGFDGLGLLAREPCTPFGERLGTTLGEGAAFFVLERGESAAARGAPALAEIEGAGSSSDGHHPTSPHPAGDGLARAALAALADAGVEPDAIDWVSAHGTGTRANDAAETRALERVFADRPALPPVTAAKGLIGHALGAAGAVEIAMAILSMRSGIVHASGELGPRRAECGVDVVGPVPREARSSRVLKLAAAFGGANAALVVASPGAARPEIFPRPRREVRIAGAGGVGPGGAMRDPMGEVEDLVGLVGPLAIEELVPGIDPRGLDAIGRHLVVAVARALGGRGALWGPAAARAGLFVGQRRASPSSHVEFEESVAARGLARASASAFTRKVVNAASGATARAFALRGPTTTVSTGASSGLVAVALAAEHLAARADADLLLAAAAEELASEEDASHRGEGAAAIALAAGEAHVAATSPRVVLAGWALAGAGAAEGALARADRLAGPWTGPVLTFSSRGEAAASRALAGLLALGRAARALQTGAASRARVVEPGPLASVAIVIERRDDDGR